MNEYKNQDLNPSHYEYNSKVIKNIEDDKSEETIIEKLKMYEGHFEKIPMELIKTLWSSGNNIQDYLRECGFYNIIVDKLSEGMKNNIIEIIIIILENPGASVFNDTNKNIISQIPLDMLIESDINIAIKFIYVSIYNKLITYNVIIENDIIGLILSNYEEISPHASIKILQIFFRDIIPDSYENIHLYEEKYRESFFILTELFQTEIESKDIIIALDYSLISLDEFIVNEVLKENITKILDFYNNAEYSDNEYYGLMNIIIKAGHKSAEVKNEVLKYSKTITEHLDNDDYIRSIIIFIMEFMNDDNDFCENIEDILEIFEELCAKLYELLTEQRILFLDYFEWIIKHA